MSDNSILVCIYIFEEKGHPSNPLTMFSQVEVQGQLLEVDCSDSTLDNVLLLHPGHYQIYGFSLIPTVQQDLLAFMERNRPVLISLELPGCVSNGLLHFLQGLHIVLLQLIPQHLPKGRHL